MSIPKVPVSPQLCEQLQTSPNRSYTEPPVPVDPHRLKHLENIAQAADEYEDWMGSNAGYSLDWPVQLKMVAEPEDRDKFIRLLNALTDALAPLRLEQRLKAKRNQ